MGKGPGLYTDIGKKARGDYLLLHSWHIFFEICCIFIFTYFCFFLFLHMDKMLLLFLLLLLFQIFSKKITRATTSSQFVTPQIPLGKSLHINNHLHHESTNKIHKCPRVINLTKFGQSLPYSGNSTQNTTCAIIIHHSHWAHLSIKYFQYYPKIFLFTV